MELTFSRADVAKNPAAYVGLTLERDKIYVFSKFFAAVVSLGMDRKIPIVEGDSYPLMHQVRTYTCEGEVAKRCFRHTPSTIEGLAELVTRYASYGRDRAGNVKPGQHVVPEETVVPARALMAEILEKLYIGDGTALDLDAELMTLNAAKETEE